MKSIESRSNPLYKQLFKWQSSAGRRDEPILLEGVHLCEAFLALGRQPQYALFDQARIHEPQLVRLVDKLSEEVCCTLSGSLLGNLSNVDTDQGVLFVVKPSSPPLPEQLVGNMLWLDRVQDPGNVGTLLRTAAAAGIVFVANCLVGWLYFALFESRGWQATPGKRLLGLRVTDLAGNRISFGRASRRYFSKLLSFLIFYIDL